jgi:hypothetical protein
MSPSLASDMSHQGLPGNDSNCDEQEGKASTFYIKIKAIYLPDSSLLFDPRGIYLTGIIKRGRLKFRRIISRKAEGEELER